MTDEKSRLADRHCVPCEGGATAMTADEAAAAVAGLDGWVLSDGARAISKRWAYKGFAKAVQMANLAAWLGDRQGHHPDIRFGWGYCEVAFTTHEAGGLTENDLICAARLNAITDDPPAGSGA